MTKKQEATKSVHIALFEDSLKKVADTENIELPFVVKDKILFTAGEWNGWSFSEDAVSKSFKAQEYTKQSRSLFIDHIEDASHLMGVVENIRQDGANIIGDLHINDKDMAIKVASEARLGISPRLTFIEQQEDFVTIDLFQIDNFSLVFDPAVRNAFLNEGDAKDSIEQDAKDAEIQAKVLEKEAKDAADTAEEIAEQAKSYAEDLREKVNNFSELSDEDKAYLGAMINSYELDELEFNGKEALPANYIKKESFDSIVTQFEKIQVQVESHMTRTATFQNKLTQANTLLSVKDQTIARLQKSYDNARTLAHKFEKEKLDEIKAKREAKFEAFVGKYCRTYNITGGDVDITKRELGTLSEAALDRISADLEKVSARSISMEPIVNSEMMSPSETAHSKDEDTPHSVIDKTSQLFAKVQQLKQSNR